jgi:hypothetical protein
MGKMTQKGGKVKSASFQPGTQGAPAKSFTGVTGTVTGGKPQASKGGAKTVRTRGPTHGPYG